MPLGIGLLLHFPLLDIPRDCVFTSCGLFAISWVPFSYHLTPLTFCVLHHMLCPSPLLVWSVCSEFSISDLASFCFWYNWRKKFFSILSLCISFRFYFPFQWPFSPHSGSYFSAFFTPPFLFMWYCKVCSILVLESFLIFVVLAYCICYQEKSMSIYF